MQRRHRAEALAAIGLVVIAASSADAAGDATPAAAPALTQARAHPPAPATADGSPAEHADRAGPIRVLLLGDSLIATEFGLELQQILNETTVYVSKRRARSATGLARQDVFDWIRAARAAVAQRRPELVVVMIGSNDGQDVVPPATRRRRPRPFRRVNWEKPGWGAAYRARVDRLLDQVAAPGREVLWLELPVMRSRSLDKKLTRVRKAQRAAVLARPQDADFLGVVTLMHSVGSPTETWRRHWRRFRRDGVHFSRRGSRHLAQMILPMIHAMAPRVYMHRFTPRPAPPRTAPPRTAPDRPLRGRPR